jgi:hypothetical protein
VQETHLADDTAAAETYRKVVAIDALHLARLACVNVLKQRLIATLEGFLLSSQRTQLASSEPRFNDLLCSVVGLLRSGEPRNLISAHIKADIARIFPSLSISRASLSLIRDVSTTARFFDLEFKSTLTLSASDRRFLRASAQLIALIDKAAERQAVEATRSVNFVQEAASSPIVHTLADWQALSMSRRGHPDAMQNHRR